MAKHEHGAPRVLLALAAGLITTITAVYGVCVGWASWTCVIMYAFSTFYVYLICRTPNTKAYTLAGSLCAVAGSTSLRYLPPVPALLVTLVAVILIVIVTDYVMSTRQRFVPSKDWNPRVVPAPVVEIPAPSPPPAARVLGIREIERNPALSRREKKALIKKERRNKN